MSADNWMTCPNCLAIANKKKDAERLKAGKSYGKVKPDEYLAMLKEAETPVELGQTFREDYEIGMDSEGGFSVSYRGGCRVCGFSHEFKHEEEVEFPV